MKLVHTGRRKLVPTILSARVGETVKFICDVKVKVAWKFNGGLLPKNVKTKISHRLKHNVLIIINIKSFNAGTYSCYGTEYGEEFEEEGVLEVKRKKLYFMVIPIGIDVFNIEK